LSPTFVYRPTKDDLSIEGKLKSKIRNWQIFFNTYPKQDYQKLFALCVWLLYYCLRQTLKHMTLTSTKTKQTIIACDFKKLAFHIRRKAIREYDGNVSMYLRSLVKDDLAKDKMKSNPQTPSKP
jgi:hypothetical protein